LPESESNRIKLPKWLLLALLEAILWGVWGALMEIPEKLIHPCFPSTLGYVVIHLFRRIIFLPGTHRVRLEPNRSLHDRFLRSDQLQPVWAYLTATIQSLNSLGCLLFVYAVRYGKAIIVVPMVNGLFPLVTVVLSLLIYQQIPARYNLTDMVLALIAIFLMAFDEVRHALPS
jgi:drug/metabolite transporter (DMT)-like permease